MFGSNGIDSLDFFVAIGGSSVADSKTSILVYEFIYSLGVSYWRLLM